MPDFLANEAARWAIGTVIASLIAGLAILVPYLQNRQRKHLWYRVSVYPVVEAGVDQRIDVLFEGSPVPNVYAAIIRLYYAGTEPLVEGDYRTPITFDFGDAKILTAELVSTKPAGINAHVNTTESSAFTLEPVALNDGNRLTARALITDRKYPKVKGHIVGIKELRNELLKRDWAFIMFLACMGLMSLGITAWFVGSGVGGRAETPLVAIGTTIATIGFIGLLAYMMWDMVRTISETRGRADED